jgi:hypothetical protein
MSESLLALILIAALFAALAAVRFFKSLDGDFWAAAGTPVIVGFVAGVIVRFVDDGQLRAVAIGVLLTIAALYVRLTGRESEPTDGMILGALTGATTALPIVFDSDDALVLFAACVIAGATAGFGITFGLSHVTDKLRQFIVDAVTAALAVAAALAPSYVVRTGVQPAQLAIGVAAAMPLLVIATVFKQWADVRAELRHEASLGFIDDADVRPTAHPLLRLGRAGWTDPGAHREFVRLANKIALRKRQQRGRPDEIARLYQLEIIKLRMHLQDMARIDHATRARQAETEEPSDTMPTQA